LTAATASTSFRIFDGPGRFELHHAGTFDELLALQSLPEIHRRAGFQIEMLSA